MNNEKENVSVGRSGINISYLRFLCDSAPGFILLLIFIIACYKNASFLGFEICKDYTFIKNLNDETQIFVLVLLFMIATPLGLLMNALSCLLFDGFIYCISVLYWKICNCNCKYVACLGNVFFFNSMISNHHFRESVKFYNIESFNHFVKFTSYFSNSCEIFDSYIHNRLSHVIGSHIFSRNLAFLSLLCFVLFDFYFFIFLALFLLMLSAWIFFYKHSHLLFDSYVIDTSEKQHILS